MSHGFLMDFHQMSHGFLTDFQMMSHGLVTRHVGIYANWNLNMKLLHPILS